MMQTYRALVALSTASALLAAPRNLVAQYTRAHTASQANVTFAASAERASADHHLMLLSTAPGMFGGDMLDSVRRQPRDLLNGIEMSRAERKAVNGIVRKNGKQLRMLEDRRRAPGATPATQTRVDQEIAALRDRERRELRKVLSPAHRRQFDRNLALIGTTGL